jgi:hypothetical protein
MQIKVRLTAANQIIVILSLSRWREPAALYTKKECRGVLGGFVSFSSCTLQAMRVPMLLHESGKLHFRIGRTMVCTLVSH